MPPVWTFEIKGEDCRLQVSAGCTLFQLMKTICTSWLDEARSGDGGVYDHMWRISRPGSPDHVGPYGGGGFDDDQEETSDHSTKIGDMAISVNEEWTVEYDFGSTTYFRLVVVGEENVSQQDADSCPRKVGSTEAANVQIFTPPEGTPSLDDLFPNAQKLLFEDIAQWIVLFHPGECVVAVEAGPNALGDMVFAPNRFSDIEETLASLDEAGTKQPDSSCRADAFSRMVFPPKLNAQGERKYGLFKNQLDDFNAAVEAAGGPVMSFDQMSRAGLSEEHMYMMCGPAQVIVRLSEDQAQTFVKKLRQEGFEFDRTFPKTAAAYGRGDWISYRRGVLQLCRGDSGERGIPPPNGVLARVQRRITSLQELFCVAEANWPDNE